MQNTQPKARSTNKREITYLFSYSISFMSLGLCMAQLGVLLPYMADSLEVSLGQISFLFTAANLGYLTGSAGGGRLYDHFKSHHLMIFGLFLMVCMGILIPLIPWFYLLLPIIFVYGIGQGMVDIGGNVNLLWVFQDRTGPFMNALHFSFGVGAFLSPIVIAKTLEFTNGALNWTYWIMAILYLPGIIALCLLKSPDNPEKDKDHHERIPINYRLVILMTALFFLYCGVEVGFSGWIFTYATELKIVSETSGSYMTSIFWGALTFGRLLGILLVKKVKPSKLLIGNFILAILFLSIILLWPKLSIALWIGSAGLGLSLSSIFPTLMTLAETRMKITGKVTSTFFIGTSLAGILIPTILGQIYEYIGSYELIVTLFAEACLGLLFLVFVISSSNKTGEKNRV